MKRTDFFRKIATAVIALLLCQPATFGQTYRRIAGWPDETNRRIESFLNSTLAMKERKVAVFDCDGTLIGQVPHYLSEESMYDFAVANYQDRQDKLSKEKWKICEELAAGDNVAVSYTQRCIDFFAGLTPDELSNAGWVCYQNKFAGKFYPEMKELLANLEEYGFEIWIVTASTELLYQRFVHEQLGIPVDRILGVKSCIRDGIVTDEVVRPIPQDAGKAEVIHTFIKARPLIVGGNSRGDMEMMHESVGVRILVNPDDAKPEQAMGGKTVKSYWENDPMTLIVASDDRPDESIEWTTGKLGVARNPSHPKPLRFSRAKAKNDSGTALERFPNRFYILYRIYFPRQRTEGKRPPKFDRTAYSAESQSVLSTKAQEQAKKSNDKSRQQPDRSPYPGIIRIRLPAHTQSPPGQFI